jgi:hypothetical protein
VQAIVDRPHHLFRQMASHSPVTPPNTNQQQGPAIAPMRALILDGDGATLVMGRRLWGLIRERGLDDWVEVAPHAWRAFEFNLGHMVAEVRGFVLFVYLFVSGGAVQVVCFSLSVCG